MSGRRFGAGLILSRASRPATLTTESRKRTMSRIATTLAASFVLAVALPGLARASEADSVLAGEAGTLELVPIAAPAPVQASADQTGQDSELASDDLTDISAGADTVNAAVTNQQLAATNENNKVITGGDFNTGDVSLGANAFTGFAGVGVFVVNTGANSNLQGSIGVSIVPTQ
jgi:hypothetical protein